MTSSQPKNSFPKTVWKFISDYWIDIPNGLIPILLGITGFFNNGNYSSLIINSDQKKTIEFWTALLIVVLTMLSLLFFVLNLQRGRRFSAIQQENESLKKQVLTYDTVIDEHTDRLLSSFAKTHLKFGSISGCYERITIYVHDPLGYFVPIGRYSDNPEFQKKGRSKYQDNQGFIAKAWQENYYFKNDYPDPSANPIQYTDYLRSEGLPANTINKIKMKSTLLFGYRIRDLITDKPIALMILESTKKNRYKQRDLQSKFDIVNKDISTLVQRLKPILPNISKPREVGL